VSIRNQILLLLASELDVQPEALTGNARWQDLRVDSLELVEVVLRLEFEFGINIPNEDVRQLATKSVGAMIQYVEERVKQ